MDRKTIALDFLRAARAGDFAAAERLVAPGARHHNPYFEAGMLALLDAILAAAQANPNTTADVKHVVAEGDCVMVHSHVRHRPEDPGIAVVHIFRFEGDRIAELWDLAQEIPEQPVNELGMF